nr:AraC family transcriptional regulator N-terminal domain-containing protein [Paenibacillus mucilaginosus]
MTDRILLTDVRTPTRIPFLSIVKTVGIHCQALTPSFCLILQGTKRLYLGQEIFHYGAGDYLASLF